MRTREVAKKVRKALVMIVVALFVIAFAASPAYADSVGPRKAEPAMGIHDQMPIQEIMEAMEALEDQAAEPADQEPGEDEECPDPDIGDGGDWEPCPDPDIGDGDDWEPGGEQFPEGGGDDVVDVPEVPQGGNEETPTETPQGGSEETPTVPGGSTENTPTKPPTGGSLPFTGGNSTALAIVGLGVILGGLAMLAMRRKSGTER